MRARKSAKQVKYKDAVEGKKGMTMVLRVPGGENAKFMTLSSFSKVLQANIRYRVLQIVFLNVLIELKKEHGWIGLRFSSG